MTEYNEFFKCNKCLEICPKIELSEYKDYELCINCLEEIEQIE